MIGAADRTAAAVRAGYFLAGGFGEQRQRLRLNHGRASDLRSRPAAAPILLSCFRWISKAGLHLASSDSSRSLLRDSRSSSRYSGPRVIGRGCPPSPFQGAHVTSPAPLHRGEEYDPFRRAPFPSVVGLSGRQVTGGWLSMSPAAAVASSTNSWPETSRRLRCEVQRYLTVFAEEHWTTRAGHSARRPSSPGNGQRSLGCTPSCRVWIPSAPGPMVSSSPATERSMRSMSF